MPAICFLNYPITRPDVYRENLPPIILLCPDNLDGSFHAIEIYDDLIFPDI